MGQGRIPGRLEQDRRASESVAGDMRSYFIAGRSILGLRWSMMHLSQRPRTKFSSKQDGQTIINSCVAASYDALMPPHRESSEKSTASSFSKPAPV